MPFPLVLTLHTLGKSPSPLPCRFPLGIGRLLKGLSGVFSSTGWTPALFTEPLQLTDHLCDPPLDVFQQIHTLLISRAPGMDAAFQVGSHKGRPEGQNLSLHPLATLLLMQLFDGWLSELWAHIAGWYRVFFSLVYFVCYDNWWIISLSLCFLRLTKLSILFSPPVLCGRGSERTVVCVPGSQPGQSTTQMLRTGGGCWGF